MKKNFIASKTFVLTGLIIAIFSGCSKEINEMYTNEVDNTTPAIVASVPQEGFRFVPNEILVKFKAGTSSAVRSTALTRVKGSVAEKILTRAMKHSGDIEGISLVKTPMAVQEAVDRMKGLVEIEYAEPNFIYTTDEISNDTYYLNGYLWGMYGDATSPSNEFGSQAGEAWAKGNIGSETVYIGIIDEGYMYEHVELADNAGTNPNEIAGNGIDDDGNGYIDDVYGWDFDGGDNSVFDGKFDDHGTHVAGIIGAVGGNGIGVAGVCWNVKLLNAKFLGKHGGTTANAILAVDYFTDLKKSGLNLIATNNSWGGGGYSQGLMDAIGRANQEGILFIASAGNNAANTDLSPSYPGSYSNDNIITVASITSTGALSGFSNYGLTSVDLGAPGSGILSTVPMLLKGKIVSGLAFYSGTSMAAPHVTGAAALYAASSKNATARKIKDAILSSVVPTNSLAGKCISGGRLDVSRF